MEIKKLWDSTFVRRWHTHPYLSTTGDTNAGHQGRTALLAMLFFPDRPNLILHALTHDVGEAHTGDIPHDYKVVHENLMGPVRAAEEAYGHSLGLKLPELSEDEVKMLKFCDAIDAQMWAKHHLTKWMYYDLDWDVAEDDLYHEAMRLKVKELFEKAFEYGD